MLIYHSLELMENKNNKLLHKLKYFGAEKINEAYNWVQDNRYKFRTEVYGPVLLEVCSLACSSAIVCFAHDTITVFFFVLFSGKYSG